MGEVYRARDTRLQRDVAIKTLLEALADDSERLARFEREARALASLNHPNIGQIHGLEESDGIKALVMELVEGPTLADRIAKGRSRSTTHSQSPSRSRKHWKRLTSRASFIAI
jgi:eukaryotic-like serine/threonine-protein kinase